MEKLLFRLTKTRDSYIFHDSRKDSVTLIKVCNALLNKVDELIDEVNALKKVIPTTEIVHSHKCSICGHFPSVIFKTDKGLLCPTCFDLTK